MSDAILPTTDMGAFMRRHDLRSRRIFVALLAASVLVAGGAFLYGVSVFGSPGALPRSLWFAMLFYPIPIIVLMLGGWVMARQRRMQPDGSLPMNPVDARGTARVANAGVVYSVGLSLIMLVTQIVSVLKVFQVPTALNDVGSWVTWRAVPVVTGILLAWFGNAWPLLPSPRSADHKSAAMRRFNRSLGWIFVLHGLMFMIGGSLLPRNPPIYSIGIGGIGASMILCAVVWGVMLHRAMKTPAES